MTTKIQHESEQQEQIQLKELELRYLILRAQLEASRDGIIMADIDGNLILYNQRFFDIWQIPADLFLAADNHKRLEMALEKTKDPIQSAIQIWSMMARPEKNGHDEVELADGRYLDRYTSAIMDDQGQIIGRIWFHRDITELKQIQKELQEYNHFLGQQVKERTAELEKLYYELQIKESDNEIQRKKLEENNKQLRCILYYMEEGKQNLQKKIESNIKNALIPFIEIFHDTNLSQKQRKIIDKIYEVIHKIRNNTTDQEDILKNSLSPTEFRIARYIAEGKNSKEIASTLSCSRRTVEGHRYSIRKKLNLKKGENLQLHLRSLFRRKK